MARWANGEQAVQFLVDRNRLESFAAEDLPALAQALVARAVLRVETTATAALAGGAPMSPPTTPTGWLRKPAWPGRPCALPEATGRTWLWRMPCRRNSGLKFRRSRSRRSSGSGGPAIQRSTLIPPHRR